MSDYLKELNSQQKSAVLQTSGSLLILAGAGAGKTKTLTSRILHLVKSGVKPSSILAITFTNKAAKEMRERVEKILSEDQNLNIPIQNQEKPFMSTFHSLGVYILKENAREIGLTKYFNIYDRNDSKKAIKESIIKNGLDPKQFDLNKILSIISKQKGNFVDNKKFEKNIENEYFPQIISKVWNNYEKTLQEQKSLDFDDLLLKTALLLKTNPDIRKKYQEKWDYIHIDEYQDTNKVQYEISKILAENNKNICVVGDIDQNIYEWRGSNIKNIFKFEQDFPNTKTILLEQNYRSTQTILTAANQIIKKNKIRKEKNLFTENEEGEKISVFSGWTETQESRKVAEKVKNLINQNISPDEIAILYRNNFQSRVLEEAFLIEKIPYQVLGTKFFDRKEIKDVISFIKASLNPESIVDITRIINVPPRGIGKTTLLKIISNKKEELSPTIKSKVDNFYKLLEKIKEKALSSKPSETIIYIFNETGLMEKLKNGTEEDLERMNNIMELVTLAIRYDFLIDQEGIERFLEDVALSSDQDELDEKNQKKESVKMMTIHASKGLEFNYIFITGLEDNLFPSKRNFGEKTEQTESQKEEERRLFYVAITRACKKVFLSFASNRIIFGSKQTNPPSEFISDIDENLIEMDNNQDFSSSNNEKVVYLEW
jgi:DNA helicase-2/ATP-dependent DNA helicase PcrA